MRFPKYTREQNLACKLTDNDIANIRSDYSNGLFSSYKLANMYKVHQSTIWYWVSESYRNRQLHPIRPKRTKAEVLKVATKWLKRKILVQPDILKYRREQGEKHRDKVRNDPIAKQNNIVYSRRWWSKHKEERRLYDKRYYDTNREQIIEKKRIYKLKKLTEEFK